MKKSELEKIKKRILANIKYYSKVYSPDAKVVSKLKERLSKIENEIKSIK